MFPRPLLALALFTCATSVLPRTVLAMPSFSRAYGQTCASCHTVYPKLNAYGEAFRRNGYRPPHASGLGVVADDTDDGWVTTALQSLSVGVAGEVTAYPDPNSLSAQNHSDGEIVDLRGLRSTAVLRAAARLGDDATIFATLSALGRIFDRAELRVTNLFELGHGLNLAVGLTPPEFTSFAVDSSYLNASLLPNYDVNFNQLDGLTSLLDVPATASFFGVIAHRLMYNVGVGGTIGGDNEPSPFAYAHLGGKAGGLAMDGEELLLLDGAARERAITLDAFGAFRRSTFYASHLQQVLTDNIYTLGGNVRAQLDAFTNDFGGYYDDHSQGLDTLVLYDEMAYAIQPSVAPAVRVEYVNLARFGHVASPQSTIFRAVAGVSAMILDSLRATLSGSLLALGTGPISTDSFPAISAPGVTTYAFDQILLTLEAAL